jgi:hypothetical protein
VKKMVKKREKWESLIGNGGIWMNEWMNEESEWEAMCMEWMNEWERVCWMNQRIAHSLFSSSSSSCLFSGGAGEQPN